MIEIKLSGTQELIAKFQRLGNFAESPAVRGLMIDAGEAYVGLAVRDVPKQSRLLKKSIAYEVTGGLNPTLIVGVGDKDVKYAAYVEFGAAPKVRRARVKRFMHWFSNGTGTTLQYPAGMKGVPAGTMSHFRKVVNHPGNSPRPFFFKHFEGIREVFMLEMAKLLADELNKPS